MIFLTETVRLRKAGRNGTALQGYILLPKKKLEELGVFDKSVNVDLLIFREGEMDSSNMKTVLKKIKEKVELDREIDRLMKVGLNLVLQNPHDEDK